MKTIDALAGTFEGSGTWYDSAGKRMGYQVKQTNRVTANGFEIQFKHDFDDSTVTDARLVMTWIAPYLFRVAIGDNPVGSGYCIGDVFKYHIKAGESFIEVSYRPGNGALEVHGSSTKNADGNYIAWHEKLQGAQ